MQRPKYTYSLICGGIGAVLVAAGAAMSARSQTPVPAPDPPEAVSHAMMHDSPATTRAAEQTVTIDNFAFTPQVLTIKPGTKVTWLNRDDVPHTATSSEKPEKFNSKALDTDDKFSQVFTTPGVYPYYCGIHPHMTATIIVKP